MSESYNSLVFTEPRPLGRALGIIPSRPNDEGLSGFPFLVNSDSSPGHFEASGVEFGASKTIYFDDPLVAHSEELVFADPEYSFRDIVLCLRVAAGARKRCILKVGDKKIQVTKL